MEKAKKNPRELIRLVIEALKVSKKVRLVERRPDVKYDESKAIVREDLDTYNGFSVGDLCIIWDGACKYIIVAFVEMTAKIKGVQGIKRKNVFCVLAIPSFLEATSLTPHHRILMATTPDGPIRLFPVGGLKKVE